MRRSYMINSQKCHFFEGDDEVHHDVEDLFDLLNIPQEARWEILVQWAGVYSVCRKVLGEANVWLMLPERYLRDFLKDAIAAINGNVVVDVSFIFKRIIQGRLDAIVGNDTPRVTDPDPTVRRVMRRLSRIGFFGVCKSMDNFAGSGVLSPEQIAEWRRIKRLFPKGSGVVNDRFFFALVMLVAPIWPRPWNVRLSPDWMAAYTVQSRYIDMCKLYGISSTQKAQILQDGLRISGLEHKAKENHVDDQPEP